MNGTKSVFNENLKLLTREKALYMFLFDLEKSQDKIINIIRNLDNEISPLNANL